MAKSSGVAGSDLPARGEGVTVDNAKSGSSSARGTASVPEQRPDGYEGRHGAKPGRHAR